MESSTSRRLGERQEIKYQERALLNCQSQLKPKIACLPQSCAGSPKTLKNPAKIAVFSSANLRIGVAQVGAFVNECVAYASGSFGCTISANRVVHPARSRNDKRPCANQGRCYNPPRLGQVSQPRPLN